MKKTLDKPIFNILQGSIECVLTDEFVQDVSCFGDSYDESNLDKWYKELENALELIPNVMLHTGLHNLGYSGVVGSSRESNLKSFLHEIAEDSYSFSDLVIYFECEE